MTEYGERMHRTIIIPSHYCILASEAFTTILKGPQSAWPPLFIFFGIISALKNEYGVDDWKEYHRFDNLIPFSRSIRAHRHDIC